VREPLSSWRVKAAVYWVLSALPGNVRVQHLIHRHVTHTIPLPDETVRKYVWLAKRHVDLVAAHASKPLGELQFYEFGAGQTMLGPLSFYGFGVNSQVVVDIRRLIQLDEVQRIARLLHDPAYGLQRPPPPSLEAAGITYRAPVDARKSPFAASSFDVVSSTVTLEHIPPDDIYAIFEDCRRILRPGGLMSSIIDYTDHYSYGDSRLGPLNYLRYASKAWRRWNPPLFYQNRLRHSDYVGMARRAGFELVAEQLESVVDVPAPTDVHGEFARYEKADLFATGSTVLMRKA